jgi:hypothetical protein
MKKIILIILIYLNLVSIHFIKAQTVGWFQNSPQSYDGYTLFAPTGSDTTYLIDNCGKLLHKWNSTYNPGNSVYLQPDGILLRPGVLINPNFPAGGKAGIIQRIDWNSNVLWSYTISNANECTHHDVKQLPNGNILAIAWEKKTVAQAIMEGRNPANLTNSFWSEKIVELAPSGTNGATIVWEWHAWDHLIQDFDVTKNNYGVVSDHPELIDINFQASPGVDWLHINSIDYNPLLDQVMVSVHNQNEIWIIDHSTTTAQAASHAGGNCGMGGDILYRWGNAEAYKRGTVADKKLFGQHDAQWIKPGIPNEGKIIVFNNGLNRPAGNYSTVEIFDPPLLPSGNYSITAPLAFDPPNSYRTYPAVPDFSFFSPNISGVMPQPNGNILICEGDNGIFFEIDSLGQQVWKYINPVSANGIITQGNPASLNVVFKIKRYETSYSGFSGQTIIPGAPIELNPLNYTCSTYPLSINEDVALNRAFSVSPNPANEFIVISSEFAINENIKITITDVLGKIVYNSQFQTSNFKLQTSNFSKGVYFVILDNGKEKMVSRFLKE